MTIFYNFLTGPDFSFVKRKIFGISHPENGGDIICRVAAEEMEAGEAERLGCDTLLIKKGNYISLNVKGYRKEPLAIKRAFDQLLTTPHLDPQGYCVEWYATDKEEVKCMIRLDN